MTTQVAIDWRIVALRLYNALTVGPCYPIKFDIHELQSWQVHVRTPALEAYEEARDEWFRTRSSQESRTGENG